VGLPDSLTQVGRSAFHKCTSLTSVVLPDSLTKLGDNAFQECTSLTTMVLPDSAQLGYEVFKECDALLRKASLAGFASVELYLRDRYKSITQKKLVLRLLRKYNQVQISSLPCGWAKIFNTSAQKYRILTGHHYRGLHYQHRLLFYCCCHRQVVVASTSQSSTFPMSLCCIYQLQLERI